MAMERVETRAALLDLARAAERLADLLAEGVAAPAPAEPPVWRSPTLGLEPIMVEGEEDLESALGRGHGVLVGEGGGGLLMIAWSDGERLRHLALTLAGDVALEAANAGVQGSRAAVDAMLRRAFGALEVASRECGHPVPAAEFVAAAARFSELDSRSAEWR